MLSPYLSLLWKDHFIFEWKLFESSLSSLSTSLQLPQVESKFHFFICTWPSPIPLLWWFLNAQSPFTIPPLSPKTFLSLTYFKNCKIYFLMYTTLTIWTPTILNPWSSFLSMLVFFSTFSLIPFLLYRFFPFKPFPLCLQLSVTITWRTPHQPLSNLFKKRDSLKSQ